MKVSKIEKTMRFVRNVLRKSKIYNIFEDSILFDELEFKIADIRQHNQYHLMEAYYKPIAAQEYYDKEGVILPSVVESRAQDMFRSDLVSGKLNELYKFRN